jgi:hypothetical protein
MLIELLMQQLYWLRSLCSHVKLLCNAICVGKVSQYALLPQGKIEAADRVLNMVAQMDAEGFGNYYQY